jgi:hypothetical protein
VRCYHTLRRVKHPFFPGATRNQSCRRASTG